MREHVCELILATRHTGVPDALDECFACDIHLAVLGASRSRFREDGVRLRAERPDLDDRAYDLQERRILGGLLVRPRIYLTDFFYARCEIRARENLKLAAWAVDAPHRTICLTSRRSCTSLIEAEPGHSAS